MVQQEEQSVLCFANLKYKYIYFCVPRLLSCSVVSSSSPAITLSRCSEADSRSRSPAESLISADTDGRQRKTAEKKTREVKNKKTGALNSLPLVLSRRVPGGVSVQRRVCGGAGRRSLLLRPHRVRRQLQAAVRTRRTHLHQRLHEAQSRVLRPGAAARQAPGALW